MESYLICRSLDKLHHQFSHQKTPATFPHLSESFWQQHRQLLAFLTALSSSSDSLLTHHRQHQPELLLSTLCDIRRPPGSDFGALLGVALTSFSVALLMLHQQHQPELLLFALRDIRCPPGSNIGALLGVALSSSCASLPLHVRDFRRPPGSNIGALLGVALSSSCASLPKYLDSRLDSHSSSPNSYALSVSTFLSFDFLQQLLSTHLAGWRASQSALSEGAFWRCFRHQQQQWTAAAVVRSRSLLPGVDSPACSYILNANIDCPPNIWSADQQPIRIRTITLLKVLTNNFINYDKIPARPLTDSGHDAGPVIDSMITIQIAILIFKISVVCVRKLNPFSRQRLMVIMINMDFFDNEFFDTNLYHVFRKDRDSVKTRCSRGGGVLIAVRRELRWIAIRLQNEDSLLDQLCVSLAGPTETIFLTVSYIPPSSSFDLYKAHVDNIAHLYQELEDGQYICVLGDFNLSLLMILSIHQWFPVICIFPTKS